MILISGAVITFDFGEWTWSIVCLQILFTCLKEKTNTRSKFMEIQWLPQPKFWQWRFSCFVSPRTFILMTEFCPLPCNEHNVFHFLGRLEQGYGTRQQPRSSTASRKSAWRCSSKWKRKGAIRPRCRMETSSWRTGSSTSSCSVVRESNNMHIKMKREYLDRDLHTKTHWGLTARSRHLSLLLIIWYSPLLHSPADSRLLLLIIWYSPVLHSPLSGRLTTVTIDYLI